MTSPDYEGLCRRLDLEDEHEALAAIRHLVAERVRLAVLVKDRLDAHEFRYGTEETPWTTAARAALSGRKEP